MKMISGFQQHNKAIVNDLPICELSFPFAEGQIDEKKMVGGILLICLSVAIMLKSNSLEKSVMILLILNTDIAMSKICNVLNCKK